MFGDEHNFLFYMHYILLHVDRNGSERSLKAFNRK